MWQMETSGKRTSSSLSEAWYSVYFLYWYKSTTTDAAGARQGVGDLETCQMSVFSAWMLLGQWSLNQLIEMGSCEFAGRMCYPKGGPLTSQTAEHEVAHSRFTLLYFKLKRTPCCKLKLLL